MPKLVLAGAAALRFGLMAVALSLTGLAAPQVDMDVVVPCANNSLVTMCYGQHANCAIDFAGDLDQFRFFGQANDVVRISAASTSVCVDPQIEVRDGANAVVLGPVNCTADCNNTCITVTELTLPATGFFTVFVTDAGNTETGNYTLHLERILAQYPSGSLTYGAPPQVLNIGHRGDHEFVTFEGEAGSDVLISIRSTSVCIDPRVDIYDPNGMDLNLGTACTADCNNTCNYSVSIPSVPLDGTYTIVLTETGRTEVGNVEVSIQCIFSPSGNCPDALVDGPFGTNYCTSAPNSTGNPGVISGYGNTSVQGNRIFLTANDLPPGVNGLLFAGRMQSQGFPLPAPSVGLNCIRLPLQRFPLARVCTSGQGFFDVDLGDLPGNMSVIPGDTWNFQFWYRDGPPSNTTDALTITFTP